MSKIDSKNIYGFEIEDWNESHRGYYLPSSQFILVGKDGCGLEATLGTASNHEEDGHGSFFESLNLARSLSLDVIIAVDNDFNGVHAKNAEKKLVEKLQNYQDIVKKKVETLGYGVFDEPEFILLLAQISSNNQSGYDQFLEKVLKIGEAEAKKSLENNEPNYRIRTSPLLKEISNYIGRAIKVEGIPKIIEGYTEFNGADKISELVRDSNYTRAIVQENGSSFTYNRSMQKKVSMLTSNSEDDLEKSKAIFDWIISNIKYGDKKRKQLFAYRGALRVYRDREGVCGESAALQVTMERLAGNIAFLVEVGAKHACAAHLRPNGEVVLIDTTKQEGFNVKYENFKILSDEHSFARE